jgi:hypothetical protein
VVSRVRLRVAAARVPAEAPDSGSAIIEFCFLAVLLMVPLTYVVLTTFTLQGAAYGVSSAAREAGRIYVSSDPGVAHARAERAAAVALADHGLAMRPSNLRVRCSAGCHEPGSAVRVTVAHRVRLPLVPAFLDPVVPTTVRVSSDHLEYVDRYRALR